MQSNFSEIPNTLKERSDLREAIIELIEQQPMQEKSPKEMNAYSDSVKS